MSQTIFVDIHNVHSNLIENLLQVKAVEADSTYSEVSNLFAICPNILLSSLSHMPRGNVERPTSMWLNFGRFQFSPIYATSQLPNED